MALTRDKHFFTIGLLEPKFWTFVLTAFADNFTGLYKEAANLKFVAEDIRMEERQLHANFRIINQIHATNIGTVLSFSNSRCSNFCSGFFRARWRVCMACQSVYVCVFLDYFSSFVCVQVIFSFCDRTTCDATSESSYEIMPSMFCLQQVTSSPCSSHSSMVTFELPIGRCDVGQANGHPFALFQRLRLVRA